MVRRDSRIARTLAAAAVAAGLAILLVAAPPAALAQTGEMTVTPASGSAGTEVAVQGAGFCCPDDVVESFNGGGSSGDYSVPIIWGPDQAVGTATVHPDGTFDGTATIPSDAEAGTDLLEVCEEAEEGACASVPFEVTVEPEPEPEPEQPEVTPDPTDPPDPAGTVVDETTPDIGVGLPLEPVATEGTDNLALVVLSVVAVGVVAAVLAAFLLWRRPGPRPRPRRPERRPMTRVVARPDAGVQTIGRPGEPVVGVGAGVDLGAGTTTLDERWTP